MAIIRDYIDGQFANDEQEPVGIDGFFTYAKVREKETKARNVPTTYLEDGSHVNDHIIREPIKITIEGNVSNTFVQPSPALSAFREAQAQIGLITQYAPGRTQTQISRVSAIVGDVKNAVDFADDVVDRARRISDYLGFDDDVSKDNIQKFQDKMDALYASEAKIDIDALDKTYKNMCITMVETRRNNQTRALDFTLEAQELRFAQTIFTQIIAAENPANGTQGQTQGQSDKGPQEGDDVPESVATKIVNFFWGN